MASPNLFTYLILLASTPCLTLILQAAALRILRLIQIETSPQLVAIFSVLAGYPVIGIIAWWSFLRHLKLGLELGIACLYGVTVYGGLAYAYFHLFNMSETARRFRILYELKSRGRMTRRELDTRYSPTRMLSIRLERLVAMGQLRKEGDRYFLHGKLLYSTAKILVIWGRLLRLSMEGRPS